MRKTYKKIIIFLIILSTGFAHTQSDKIHIKTDHLTEANYLQMDDFYLTHHLYIDLFLRENLFPEASPEDVVAILNAIKKYVSVENKLDIEIEKPGDRNYLIRAAILKKDDGTELFIVFTNWSAKKKMFEKEIAIKNDSYTRWYFLNGTKMTYRKEMSDQHDYANMDKTDLADAYLFDELTENDTRIKSLIDEALNTSGKTVLDNIWANLMLLKYYIFERDAENVAKQTMYLSELFKINALEDNIGGLEMAFDATKFQIELMRLKKLF